jgi:NDP-sugar pyrophosphorylase family protein
MSLPVAILVGGLATRLRPLTEKIPKALVEINGEPFILHQLRLLHAAGLREVVICAWYRGELIREFAGDGRKFGVKISYSFDGETLLGTGGAIQKALPYLGNAFFMLYGDSYLPCNYAAVEAAYRTARKDGLMTVYHNLNQGDQSNVEYSDGKILIYDKQNRSSKMEYIDYGLGIFNARAFDPYPLGQPLDLADVYQRLLDEGQLAGYEVTERFYEIGSFEGVNELEIYLKRKIGGETSK